MQHTYKCDECDAKFYTYCFGSPEGGAVVYEPPLIDPKEYWPRYGDPMQDFDAAMKIQMEDMFSSKMIALCTEHLEEYYASL